MEYLTCASNKKLPPECMQPIFALQDIYTLHQCVRVNKYFCLNSVRFLWKDPFAENGNDKRSSVIDTLVHFMSRELKLKLGRAYLISNKTPLFRYPLFIERFNFGEVVREVNTFIKIIQNECRDLLYQELIRICSFAKLSLTANLPGHKDRKSFDFNLLSLSIRSSFDFYGLNPFLYSESVKLFKYMEDSRVFDVIEIPGHINPNNLYEISKCLREKKASVNSLVLHLGLENHKEDFGFEPLVDSFREMRFLSSYIPKNCYRTGTNLNIFKEAISSVGELEIRFCSDKTFLEIISQCLNLRKLKIVSKRIENFEILKIINVVDIPKNLESLCVCMQQAGILGINEIDELVNQHGFDIFYDIFSRTFVGNPDKEPSTAFLKITLTNNKNELSFVSVPSSSKAFSEIVFSIVNSNETSIKERVNNILQALNAHGKVRIISKKVLCSLLNAFGSF